MKSFFITKQQAALLCLILTLPYLFLYYMYFGNNYYSLYLTSFFYVGVLLHFFHKIEPGTRAEVVFFGKATGGYWEDGFCLVPSIMPVIHYINTHLLWSLKKSEAQGVYRIDRDISIDQYVNQRRPNYNMNVQSTHVQIWLSRVIESIIEWFSGIQKGDEELVYQRLGVRIIVIAILGGISANFFFPKSHTSNSFPFMSSSGDGLPKPKEGESAVYSSLRHGRLPIMPLPENFTPRPKSNTQLFFFVSQEDPRKYYLFHEPPLGGFHTVAIHEPLCALIPAGREMIFITKYRPQYEANMVNLVEYAAKAKERGILSTLSRSLLGLETKADLASWEELYNNWEKVDVDNYGIKVQALANDDLPESSKNLGGIVCF